jgi:hypothetical protein
MPDMSGTYRAADSWKAHGDAEATLEALVAAARRAGGTVQSRTLGHCELSLGSRIGYRILGVSSPIRMRPIRLRIQVSQESPAETLIVAEVADNAGWYAINIKRLSSPQFAKAFARIFGILRSAAPSR